MVPPIGQKKELSTNDTVIRVGGCEHPTLEASDQTAPLGGCCGKDRTSWDYMLDPKASVTNDHKEGGVKSQKYVLLGSGGQRTEMKVGSEAESSSAFLLASAAGLILGLWTHRSSLLLFSYGVLPCVSPCPSSMRASDHGVKPAQDPK